MRVGGIARSGPAVPAAPAPRGRADEDTLGEQAGVVPVRPARVACVETFIVTDPSGSGPNEDAAVARGRVAVLADGAGIPARWRSGCTHTVSWYSHRLVEALAGRLAAGDGALGMREALARAIAHVRSLHEGTCDLDAGSPSATVVAVREADGVLEHLLLCDSSLLLRGRDGAVRRVTDRRIEEVVARAGSDEEVEALRNWPGGFWVARHEEAAAGEAIVGSTPVAGLGAALLVSDGVTRVVDLLGLCDDAALARDCADADGARGAIAAIRGEEAARAAAGTLGVRKAHDDATVLGLRFCRAEKG